MLSLKKFKNLFYSARPRQWSKNLICLSAVIITPVSNFEQIENIIWVTLGFIFASSFIYQINDLVDLQFDKLDSIKCKRPLASGILSKREIIYFSIFLFILFIFCALKSSNEAFFITSSYTLIQILYCKLLKNIPIFDIYAIALGFILRALSGVIAVGAIPSSWFLITTGFMALFLATQKRKFELARVSKDETFNLRAVLRIYTKSFLEKLEILSLTSGFITYVFWASGPILNGANSSYMLLTSPILLAGINRYQLMSQVKNGDIYLGESPTNFLFQDKGIQSILIFWLLLTLLITYANF